MAKHILGENFARGMKLPNFFNGRLLSAEDLEQGQTGMLNRIAQTGRGVGHGIIRGLTVSKQGNHALVITRGIGINKNGDIVHFKANQIRLSIHIAEASKPTPQTSGVFQTCPGNNGTSSTNQLQSGAYLLTVTPIARNEEFAPVKAIAGQGNTHLCTAKWEVEGVAFARIPLPNSSYHGGDTQGQRRNILAHWCYGTADLMQMARQPFVSVAGYGELDDLADLTNCDLPLAVFFWNGTRITFVDMWSVRRRLVHPCKPNVWQGFTSDQRAAEGEARFLQFQQHVDQLTRTHTAATVRAANFFRYLPPVGFLPIRLPEALVREIAQRFTFEVKKVIAPRLPDTAGTEAAARKFIAYAEARFAELVIDNWPYDGTYRVERFFGEDIEYRLGMIDEHVLAEMPSQSWYLAAIELERKKTNALVTAHDHGMLVAEVAAYENALEVMFEAQMHDTSPHMFDYISLIRTFDTQPEAGPDQPRSTPLPTIAHEADLSILANTAAILNTTNEEIIASAAWEFSGVGEPPPAQPEEVVPEAKVALDVLLPRDLTADYTARLVDFAGRANDGLLNALAKVSSGHSIDQTINRLEEAVRKYLEAPIIAWQVQVLRTGFSQQEIPGLPSLYCVFRHRTEPIQWLDGD